MLLRSKRLDRNQEQIRQLLRTSNMSFVKGHLILSPNSQYVVGDQ